MTDVSIAAERADQPDVCALIEALDALQLELYPAESCHFTDVNTLMEPGTTFLVARKDRAAVGCGAFLTCDGYGEIKRMFVSPKARGLGLGRMLVTAIEDAATAQGLTLMRLETGVYQPEAVGLYESAGYERRKPFGTYREDPLSIFMEKALG